eukprot:CAMPEP_0170985942 /NCGR_PEP_ID=MMETSP0736-20130129/5784_1 /TAXON_ID=186038 /ORGANISM="Fragilariopsis kerguelensis, Strain L26-C5" /LENGTH=211 /DNA_ID=CAMNT_0011409977 /DNA_START=67 /DNA_END=705 /DNA_ORIENTATION=+
MEDPNKTPTKCDDGLTKTESTATAATDSPTSNDSSDIHDSPEYIPPDQQDMMLHDVTLALLRTRISEELGVTYLSKAFGDKARQSAPLFGSLYSINRRLMVNVVTRRRGRRGSKGPEYPSYNIIFLCDTGSPNTFICEEAMLALLENSSEPIAPQTMFVKMANFPMVEAHMSPKDGKFHEVNVIGMDLLSHLKTTILGKRLEFELAFMSDS